MKFNFDKSSFLFRNGLLRNIMRTFILLFCASIFAAIPNNLLSQNSRVRIDEDTMATVDEVFDLVSEQTDYKFFYEEGLFKDFPMIHLRKGVVRANKLLSSLSLGNLEIRITSGNLVAINEKPIISNKERQTHPVSGNVVDNNGQPLPGANIVEKGTSNGTQTDFDGNFEINVADSNAIIVISYLGFVTQEVPINGQKQINVTLSEDTASLDEVVVVGYGTQKKENVTGAVSSVDFEEVISGRAQTTSSRALQGAIPGLNISFGQGRPGTGADIDIRGIASINGRTGQPLILLDNVPVNLEDVNPNDIKSISVLKDASSSAIYGGRAAFGVVLITTKKGVRNSGTNFNYSTTMSISKPTEVAKAATTAEFVRALTDFGTTTFWTGQDIPTWLGFVDEYEQNPGSYPLGYAENDGLRYPLAVGDVLGDFIDNQGLTQVHNFNFSGGGEKSNYRVSLGYSDEDGIMVTDRDSFTRYNLNGFIESEIATNLTASLNTLYRASNRLDPIGNYNQAVSFYSFTPAGNFVTETGEEIPYDTPSNIVRLRTPDERDEKTTRLTGKLQYKPINGLTLTGEYTFENSLRDTRSTDNQPLTISSQRFTPNGVGITNYSRTHLTTSRNALNLYGSYEKSLGNHNFSFLAGFNQEEFSSESFTASGQDLINPDIPFLDGTTTNPAVEDFFGEWAVQGVFGRFTYNYAEKYLLEANARYDGSSRFPKNDRFGVFPSFSAGWVVSKEGFFEPLTSVVTSLKFRGSWGDIGNQITTLPNDPDTEDFYPFLPGLPASNSQWIDPTTGNRYITVGSPALVSPSFTWERARTLNLGMDASFFNNRFTTTLEWFNRKVLDQLDGGLPAPAVLGAAPPLVNVADSENLGWEVTLGWQDTIGDDFSYYINANVSDVYKSEITSLNNDARLLNSPYVGREFGEIWGLQSDGFFTVDDFVEGTLDENLQNGTLREGLAYFQGVNPNPGDAKYVDLDGNGVIQNGSNDLDDTQDRTIIGNSRRRYRYGASGGASYKGFDFSFRLVGVGKRAMNINNRVFWPYDNQFQNIFQHQLDYWTPENTDAFYPRIYIEGQGNYPRSRATQSRYLSNGAYLTVQNITFGYSIPQSALDKTFIDNVRIFFTAENPIMIDHLPDGLHPEFENLGGGGTYPFRKQYGLGLNMTF
ncbi:SusC/RagA family TonB-linked outer membrane protein [Maribacter algicola]|uniref:SusC/RagA family TonB-linked outer membrane protein n=1 Tax=Meishania litoralis TaxID=3434685 RepID=A0ACC7LJE0_9FLAO